MGVRHALGWWVVAWWSIVGLTAAGGDTSLAEAVKSQDKGAVAALLNGRVDVNVPLPDGATALHWAAYWNDMDTADRLIRAGAKVDVMNRYGVTPLVLASTNGSAAMAEKLVRAGADPNGSPKGEPVLMTASRAGDVETVKVLLAHEANPNARETERGHTALMWAAAEGHEDVARLLLDYGAEVDARSIGGFTPLAFAVQEGRPDLVRFLVDAGADPNLKVKDATEHKGFESVSPEDTRGGPLVFVAINSRHYEVAALLLDKGADPNALHDTDRTALHVLVTASNPVMINQRPQPVRVTGSVDRNALMKSLLAHGADPNRRIGRENKALISVGEERRRLDRGGLDPEGATPLVLAAAASDVEAMRILAAGGADPLIPTKNHTTVIMAAAGMGFDVVVPAAPEAKVVESVRVALELGGDVTAANGYGQTALHGAVYRAIRGGKGAVAAIPLLIGSGAKLDAMDELGRTPLMLAEDLGQKSNAIGHDDLVALLRALGGHDLLPR